MAWGFKAINNAGAIQIDGTFSNMSMYLKGQGIATKDGTLGGTPNEYGFVAHGIVVDFPERPNPPLVAVQPCATGSNYDVGMSVNSISGPASYWGLQAINRIRIGASNAWWSYPVTNYNQSPWQFGLFDRVGDVLDDTDWGMQVFAENGEVMFDSRASYLEVIDEINVVIPPPIRERTNWGQVYWRPDPGPIMLPHEYLPNAWYVINTINGTINGSAGPYLGSQTAVATIMQTSPTMAELSWPFSLAQSTAGDSRQDGKMLICQERFI
jgi:hypothetical protein